MSRSLVVKTATLPAHLEQAAQQVENLIAESVAPATRRAYASDWRIFTAWCEAHGLESLPAIPATVAMFLAAQSADGVKPATLARRVAAIKYRHDAQNETSPTAHKGVSSVMSGIRRRAGSAKDQKTPATAEKVEAMIAHCPDTLAGFRDRAILLLGFAGAFRRSELAALTVADLTEVQEGLRVLVRRSKTDQTGEGQIVPIFNGTRLCPATAVRDWLQAAQIKEGPLFRRISKGGKLGKEALTDKSVALIVKHYAELAGFDSSEFSGHSLRSGFLTSAAENQADLFKMMEVSRHKRVETVKGYIRMADLFRNHAGSGFL